MDLVSLITILGGFFGLLSVMVSFFLFLANKIDAIRADIQKEMTDFHGRLERQDAEFKAGFLLMEEKYHQLKEKT